MRVAVVLALLLLGGCASEKWALTPPPGIDFTGQWRLDEADSDDPQRLVLSSGSDRPQHNAGPAGGSPGGQGRGGRSSGGSGAPGSFGGAGPIGPLTPTVSALSDGLRWPGKEMDIKQVGGVLAITSAGLSRVFQPMAADNRGSRANSGPRDRGDGPAPSCGWDDKTWVLQFDGREEDRAPSEKRYSISVDGQRLVEVLAFKSGRSAGFTTTRVWDRVLP